MSDYVIINGFDRSGTSAISRVLACHPKIELIMQPFNSGSIRSKINEILDEETASKEDIEFFSGLSKNRLIEKYIKSEWHYKFSTTREYIPGKTHLIKTTINHFCQEWMNVNHSEIEVWGIWRDPVEVMESSIRNGFNKKWYTGFSEEIAKTIEFSALLKPIFDEMYYKIDNEIKELAYIIAVRSYYFFYYLDKNRILHFQHFVKDPNTELNRFINSFGLEAIDFEPHTKRDLNIIGKRESHNDIRPPIQFTKSDRSFIDHAFEKLYPLIKPW